MELDPAALFDYGLDMVRRAPHLYLLTVAYWVLIGSVLLTRYALARTQFSETLMRAVAVLGVLALVLTVVDVAIRGQELIQISLVAYFATPLGLGRYFIRRWDKRPATGWSGVRMREVTYVGAFLAFVLLSIVAGDPWWFSRPEIDRSDTIAMIENTNWLHLMATVFGATAVIEAVMPIFSGFSEDKKKEGSKAASSWWG